jgi:predicted N-formylglutamate amidohydrolase
MFGPVSCSQINGDIANAALQLGKMNQPWKDILGAETSALLLIADHASNRVPDGIDLGIDQALLEEHIAIDLGVAPLATALCAALACPGILGNVSRLVVDLNREEDATHIIPTTSDGYAIPGNVIGEAEQLQRINRFWRPYHQRIEAQIAHQRPRLLISLHSFTPQLTSRPGEARPWEVGILYNQDDRAARLAIPALDAADVIVGDQLPYSGKTLNATMNRHGEANGIAYLGIEMRQDLIGDAAGVAHWCGILAPVIELCLKGLASDGELRT